MSNGEHSPRHLHVTFPVNQVRMVSQDGEKAQFSSLFSSFIPKLLRFNKEANRKRLKATKISTRVYSGAYLLISFVRLTYLTINIMYILDHVRIA